MFTRARIELRDGEGATRYGIGPLNVLAAADRWHTGWRAASAVLVDEAGEVDIAPVLSEILALSERARGHRCSRLPWLNSATGIRRHLEREAMIG